MKKLLTKLPAFFLAIILTACGTPAVSTTPATPVTAVPAVTMSPQMPATEAPAVVTFTDPVLEEMVRGAMGRPQGDITAAEAGAVTRLNLSAETQQYISEETPIKNISGLENFTNLEELELSYQAVTDLSPLEGLNKLTALSLDENPVADITPLAGMTNLQYLTISNCAAQDYSPLAKLVNLKFLRLDNSTISDVSPLASLTNLKHLYLLNSPVNDYSLLLNIYPNLANKDFIIASTLEELGFAMSDDNTEAKYADESLGVIINHSEWGPPPREWDANGVRLSLSLEDGYILKATFHPDIDAYVFGMGKDGEPLMNYVYDRKTGSFTFGSGDRQSSEQAVLAAMDAAEGEDVLLAPMRVYDDTIIKTFNMTADRLYSLPFGPPTLKNLGFFPDTANAVWLYEQREENERDVNIEIHRPEWGEKDFDFSFFTALSDEYRVFVIYHSDERKVVVKADDNDLGGAEFEYFIDTREHIDVWCSNKEMTVEEYFIRAFNDPAVDDIYQHSWELLDGYIRDRFGMTLDELLVVPEGE